MTYTKFTTLVILLVCSSLISGCAVIFSAKNQRVNIKTATPDAKIVFNDDSVGTGTARIKLNKYKVYHEVTVKKEGYKSRNYYVSLNKHTPTICLMMLDFVPMLAATVGMIGNGESSMKVLGTTVPGFGLIASIDVNHVKTHRYNSMNIVPELIPFDNRKQDEKYLLVNNTAVDVKADDATIQRYSSLKKYNKSNSSSKKGKSFSKEDLKVDNTIFTGALNTTLKKMKFIDTNKSIFPNVNNALYINSTVKKIAFHWISSPYGDLALSSFSGSNSTNRSANNMFCIEMTIDWDVLNFYKEKICTITTMEKSDMFTVSPAARKAEINELVYKVIKDNMEYAIMNVRKQLSEKDLLKTTNIKENVADIILNKPAEGSRKIDDLYRSSVTIKVDDGLGSGVIVSDDGYIITNYHLVAGSKKIEVTFNDTSKAEAEIVRKNSESDMVLLKVKKTGLVPFTLSLETDPEIGVDVWAIGVTKSIELGQSVSKGIISGLRKSNGMTMLQTDASLNSGNSGSALVTKDGVVIGVVALKLSGNGTEGIGFALLSKEVMEKLGLKYK